MIARFVGFVLLVMLGWILRGMFGRPAPPVRGAGAAGPKSEGEMVRDRVCNTFLPRSRALRLDREGETHYFCSEACRASFIERHRAAS